MAFSPNVYESWYSTREPTQWVREREVREMRLRGG
jgi:hypothetical protein